MSLIIMDGFEGYTDGADIDSYWEEHPDGTGAVSYQTGRHIGSCLRLGTTTRLAKRIEPATELFAGFSFKFGSTPTGDSELLGFAMENWQSNGYRISLNSDKKLELMPFNSFTQYGTGTTVLSTDTWYHLEVRIVRSDTAGIFHLKLDGSDELNLTSLDTQYGAYKYEKVTLRGHTGFFSYDDLWVCDTNGTLNNSWLGHQVIELIRPDGAGNYSQWTASAGSNYECVDETDSNGDTDYVGTTSTGQKDTYTHGNLTQSAATIAGVKVLAKTKASSGDFTSVKPMVRSSTTDEVGDVYQMEDSYATASALFETDPNTSSAWSKTGVNGAEFGVSS